MYPSNSGNFTWPRGATTGTFTEGSTMNISWTTGFTNVNLWLIIDQSWGSPVSLVSSYSTPWYNWEVKCGQNCTKPFLLRAVNAAGSDFDQQHGGFYSYQFWIKPADGAIKTTTVPFTIVSTEADLAPTASAPSASSSTSSATSSSAATSSRSTASDVLEPTSVHTTTSAIAPTINSADTNESTPAENSSSSTAPALSIGVGVGAGVAAALICLGRVFLWRRHHRKIKDTHPRPPPIEMYGQGWQKHYETSVMYPPSRMASSSKSMAPAEAPGWPMDPYELPAQTPRGLGVHR
ncbi:hypothetical protein D6D27_10323 [Aureobasidium pullulans]|nr:hypothetical protein D6D27_10323 [Aureobasidium pullulans]